MSKILTNEQIVKIFGKAGDITNHVTITSPFDMVLDWDKNSTIRKFTCHKLVAERLKKIFAAILCTYGEDRIRELGINQFAGCFNHRPKRGLESKYAAAIARKDWTTANKCLSTHSWAVAIDLDADRNTLRETKRTARFARPEYKAMIDIFYAHDFVSYGVEKDYDWMHFEAAK